MEKTKQLGIKLSKEAVFILLAVVCAVAIPQIVHGIGVLTGTGAILGKMLLPMYIPIFIIGFYRGPVPGIVSGILAPLASFMITEMPASAILPYIMLELAVIGALSGLLSKRSYPAILRVLFVQICAKAIRIAVFAAGFAISNGTAPSASTLFGDVVISLPGVALQLIVLTLVLMSKEIKNAK